MKRGSRTVYPKGWNAKRVKETVAYYESQSEEEAAAEIEEGLDSETETLVLVPKKLVPAVRQLIARAG